MKAIFFISLFSFLLLFTSCDEEVIHPSGETVELTFDFEGYSGLYLANSFNVDLSFSDTEESIRIIADENVMPYVEIFTDGDFLALRLKEDIRVKSRYTLSAVISTEFVDKYQLSGASEIEMQDLLAAEEVQIQLSGASKFNGTIDAVEIFADLSGASEMTLEGITEQYYLELSGASKAGDFDFASDYLEADLSGASYCNVTVNEEIKIRASGASFLNFKGPAVIVEQDISGGSAINHL